MGVAMRKSKLFLFIFLILTLFSAIKVSFADGDLSNLQTSQTKFILTSDAIQVQKDETDLEKQRLEKEARFEIGKDVRQNYINAMWSTYSATITLIGDLFLMIFYIIILRLFFVLTFELIPMLITKITDILEDWFA